MMDGLGKGEGRVEGCGVVGEQREGERNTHTHTSSRALSKRQTRDSITFY